MVEELSQVASLLAGDVEPPPAEMPPGEAEPPGQETDPSAETTDEPPPAETPPATLTVKQIAERLETTPKEFYDSLQISIGGRSMSLSEVKDRGKDLFGAEQKLNDADAHRLATENDILRQNQALTLRASKLGGNATQAEIAEAQTTHNEYVRGERDRALAAIPEWSNPAVQQAEVKLVGEMLVEAGFSPHEIANKIDHRDIKIYREYSLLKDRLMKVKSKEVIPKSNQKPGARRKTAPKNKGAAERFKAGEMSQTAAVLTAIADGTKQ